MRHVKQLIYGIFYLALWAAFIGGIYAWQKPAPSCFDNSKNQNETGIDCGGVCSKVCIPEAIAPLAQVGDPKLIVFDNVSAVPPQAPRVSIVSEVQNSNLDFGASSFEYVFNVYGQGGEVIASFPGRSFIYAGEIKRLALLNETLPLGSDPSSAKIVIQKPIWTPIARLSRPELTVQTANTIEDNGNLVTQGILVNQDSVDFATVYITAVYYDQNGAVIGVTGTERNTVAAGESREFALFHPMIPSAAPERTQVFVTALNLK
jgi:hypothetical protein